jgi:predicted DNA-binding transcriptional regulator AlpA
MPRRATKNPRKPIELPADDDAFIRLPTVLAVYPVGENTWWSGIKAGIYPRAYKLSARVSAWKVSDIRALLAARAAEEQP